MEPIREPSGVLGVRIRDEIRRGVQLVAQIQASSEMEIDSVYVRVFLDGAWQEVAFDGVGNPIPRDAGL